MLIVFWIPKGIQGVGPGQDMSGAMGAVPNLEGVIPATPHEVEEFLILNPVEEHAQGIFRQMDPKGQRMVINRGRMDVGDTLLESSGSLGSLQPSRLQSSNAIHIT